MKTTPKKNGGFTLVELIVVIAILAILAAVAIPAYSGYIEKAEKANDLQLLGAVNTAFNAACMENNIFDMATMEGATFSLDSNGLINKLTLPGGANATLAASFTATQAEAILDSFALYYGDNMTTGFTVFKFLAFADGAFEGKEISDAFYNAYNNILQNFGTQVGLVQDSAFTTVIGPDRLLSQVVDVSSMAADLIYNNGEGSALTAVVLDPGYIATMASKLGKDPEVFAAELEAMAENDPAKFSQYMANSTVLNVANTMNTMSAEEEASTKNMLANLNFGNLATTLNTEPEKGLSQAALLYGMYTAFAPEDAANMVNTADVTALMNLGDKTNASGMTFAEYIAQVNTEGSQAAKDYAGYKSALDIVNQSVSNDKDVANQVMNNGYSDTELAFLLGQVMGN